MDRPSRPRAFISYRHIEHETGAAQDTLNAAHRQWVETFAADLSKWQVDAVFDGHLREIFRPYTAQDPFMVPFLAEVSTICSLICHAFIPILTPSYIERLGYGNYEPQRETKLSFVQEEWQIAIYYANTGLMQYIPIVRAGEPERMAALPLGGSPDNGFDMRDPADYPHQVRFIAERISAAWDGDHALIKLGLKDWVMTCISWCRENYPGCAEKWVDAWPIDLLRPRLFLDRVFQTSACSQAQ